MARLARGETINPIRADGRGSIPAHLAPILTRIGVDGEHWYAVVTRFGKLFKRAAG